MYSANCYKCKIDFEFSAKYSNDKITNEPFICSKCVKLLETKTCSAVVYHVQKAIDVLEYPAFRISDEDKVELQEIAQKLKEYLEIYE